MGIVDLCGKIFLEILLFSIALILLTGTLISRLTIALLIAHTLNWLFNSHFWTFGRYLGITKTYPARFPIYLKRVVQRLDNCKSINSVIVIGGASRKEGIKPTSDVDIFFIPSTGICNGIRSVVTTFKERALAFICKFPLHLELYDNIKMMDRHRKDETPFVLKDDLGLASDYYSAQGRKISGLGEYGKQTSKTA